MHIIIGVAAEWLVYCAKEHGIDINGFNHEITEFFKKHVFNEHGNTEREKLRGQIPVTEEHFEKLAAVVSNPDFLVIGAKRDGIDIFYYSKKISDGTIIYAEDRLSSNKHKSLCGKTMFIRKKDVNEKKFKNLVSMNKRTDMTNAKIVSSPKMD